VPRARLLAAGGLTLALGFQPAPAGLSAQYPQQAAPPAAVAVDLVVLDRDGRVADTLSPADLTVTVDRKPRRVLWIRRVSRGPGAASEAALRQERGEGTMAFAAEPSRSVLVVVDQATFARGDERSAVQAAAAFLDRLGLDDRIAVVRIPLASDTPLTLTADRPAAREALAAVVGQAARAADIPIEDPSRNVAVAVDPEVQKEVEPPLPQPVDLNKELNVEGPAFSGLAGLLNALRSVPGRKAIALFSAGLPGSGSFQVDEIGAAAAAAHAVIYTFGLPMPRGESAPRDVAPLESLAKSTGGTFVMLSRNTERSLARVVEELSACYVAGLEPGESDADGRRRALRVETPRKGLTVRAASWLVATPDAGDVTPSPSPSLVAGPVEPVAPESRGGPEKTPAGAAESREREAELQLALARLLDYIAGYERQYSGLVAEETYLQSTRTQNVRLRSDFLLVRLEDAGGWVSFRDVFEVDGHRVRDREDRLKRLFLDPTPEAVARLKAVKEESARYNIGPVVRNINVPLYPLVFLVPENRPGFEFKLSGRRESAGLSVWRIDYKERGRPTVIRGYEGVDVPASGWFLIDQLTGAIVESGLALSERRFTVEIVVSYRRDEALGLWVPAEMREKYKLATMTSGGVGDLWASSSTEGRATYSNFRRFQVKTEEKVAIPK
jgi:VWFA-related protein